MSDSKDLDSYGDWVKKPPRDINGEDSSGDDMAVDIFDIPDFAEPKLDASGSAEQASDAEDNDTTLSPEELAHITINQEMTSEEFEDPTIDPAAAALGDVFSEEAKLAENAEENFDEFDIPASMDEPLPEEIEVPSADEFATAEETSLDAMADGEIDLDSFMDDSGGSSGEISFEDGEIDLDDFMGGDFMGGGGAPSSKAPAEIQDEQTLDINIGFDEDAENIALEDTPENEAKMFPKKEEPAHADGDAMFNSFEEAVAADISSEPAAESETLSADDGEIDLSEFGFDDDDSNIGMTEGPDGNDPLKKEVVDYDVRVVVDDDSKTPPVQDVVNGKIVAEDQNVDSEEDEITEQNELTGGASNTASPEISEKGKEILEDIIGQLASLKDEIKSLKNEFANLSARPANEIPAIEQTAEEDTGFFGNDDGDDTIALSGSEMTNILNSAQFSEESADENISTEEETFEPPIEEPFAEDTIEETSVEESEVLDAASAIEEPAIEINETEFAEPTEEPVIAEDGDAFISDDDLGIKDPTLESLSEDNGNPIPPTILPEEIAVPKGDFAAAPAFSETAEEEFAALESKDISYEDSLTSEKLEYLNENSAMPEEEESSAPNVAEIVQENISLQDNDEASIGIDSNIDAAFEEADALESDIMDNSLEEKAAYEDSVSDIMNENISLQDDKIEASVGIGSDINTAFEEADAAESDIMDDSLAEKDAYEKKINELVDDDGDSLGLDNDETAAEEQIEAEDVTVAEVQEPIIEDSLEETSVEEPTFEEPLSAETAAEEPSSGEDEKTKLQQNSIPKNLREEVISVLSYMDQLLENLPEEKITEFAKSEHFVTYKKLFDELGLS
ncbi:MAG: hypothetical protein K2N58_04970 [Treponemataceae bacterium]|nr:hypothetical protein [Treponemataceae bacterium]